MMKRLHPAVLEELGLLAALNDLIDNWNDHHEETFCHFKSQGDMEDLSREISITAYRLVQECLTNVAKHAQATDIYIELINSQLPTPEPLTSVRRSKLANNQGILELNIEDNGLGFDQVKQKHQMSGLGLLGMRERVEALGGLFKLETEQGGGTKIQVVLPLEKEETSRE
jgi:signal transduction histidine kinase